MLELSLYGNICYSNFGLVWFGFLKIKVSIYVYTMAKIQILLILDRSVPQYGIPMRASTLSIERGGKSNIQQKC